MAKQNAKKVIKRRKERKNIDTLKQVLYDKVRQLHVQKYPYNDFLFQQYDESGEVK